MLSDCAKRVLRNVGRRFIRLFGRLRDGHAEHCPREPARRPDVVARDDLRRGRLPAVMRLGSPRKVAVLRSITDGCAAGIMESDSHRISAAALA